MVLRVAVIGAGAAGLAALRRLAAKPAVFEAVAMEQAATVGGTWVYNERVGLDEEGVPIHSSMYANLRTNLPKETMAFPGFPFQEPLPSFVTHQQVNSYLSDFADQFNIKKFIRFNTQVEKVRPVTSEPSALWEVTSRCRHDTETKVETFDAVFVCNGHFAIPLVPDLPGQDEFTGRIQHSHNYRHPEDFSGQRVVLLGAASSGQDITLDLAPHASKVYLCHRKAPLRSSLPENVEQKSGVRSLRGSTVLLQDGEELTDIDTVLLCTGYRYTFPFLAPDCAPSVHDERVHPVYKHIVHAQWPSLFFIGLCKVVLPFPQFDCQVRFALAALEGTMELPSRAEMERDIEEDFAWRLAQGMPHRHAHHMGDLQWAYNDMLAGLAGFEALDPVVPALYGHVHVKRRSILREYKKLQFKLTGPDTFIEVPSKHPVSNGLG